ncbi:addiction module antidote protein, HigA family [Pandoraea terrae]|uniref:Addiction module antidote protein, HigA family n=1 Tax=Pandoraea terrae TaxID=1537710 RepID=A0A5E4ZDD1_9BURK|nr:HigA family addiction module antitoxin [Pandoraea terrae]VVE59299.1 addiction module antidote protein, HigA family [Pandoraea terrae]
MVIFDDGRPTHPGVILRGLIHERRVAHKTVAADLGIGESTLSKIITLKAGVSAAMAIKLEAWDRGYRNTTAKQWMAWQSAFELAQAEERVAA